MIQTTWRRHVVGTLLLLVVTLVVFESSNIDLRLQDYFYRGAPHDWLVNAKEPIGRLVCYSGIKVLLVGLGISLGVGYVGSFRIAGLRDYRNRFLLMILALAIVPSVVGALKSISNVYYPDQLERYGGNKPYVKVLSRYPPGYVQTQRGHGYPAGHASGGFALMMLYFVFRSRRARLLGFSAGLVVGWVMGVYQMAKGAHFLSHTVVTMLLAWLIILIIYRLAGREASVSEDSATEMEVSQRLSATKL
jgi:membrane-associated PAP2 superfamily phosphatase